MKRFQTDIYPARTCPLKIFFYPKPIQLWLKVITSNTVDRNVHDVSFISHGMSASWSIHTFISQLTSKCDPSTKFQPRNRIKPKKKVAKAKYGSLFSVFSESAKTGMRWWFLSSSFNKDFMVAVLLLLWARLPPRFRVPARFLWKPDFFSFFFFFLWSDSEQTSTWYSSSMEQSSGKCIKGAVSHPSLKPLRCFCFESV